MMPPMAKRVALVGASGYAGRELDRLLGAHPGIEVAARTSARADRTPSPGGHECEPPIEPFDPAVLEGLDGVFLCTPSGVAMELAPLALEAGCRVVDLSADFRFADAARYERAYGAEHAARALCAEAVYGLTEHAREDLRDARLVANPGCYPTAVLLGILPLLEAGLVERSAPIVADCKSGVSGAGKAPSERTVYGAVHENACAYAVGQHRHAPEIWEHAGTERIVFVPHLLPAFRGILATLYFTPADGADAGAALGVLLEAYGGEPFVRVLRESLPDLAHVQRTNQCHLAVRAAYGQVVVLAAIDNLVKGAAGQALQNMNLALGLEETAGLA